MEEIKTFLNQKKATKSNITRLKNKTSEDINTLNFASLNVRKNRVKSLIQELNVVFSKIIGLCSKDEDIETYCEEKEEMLETCDEMLANLDTLILNCDESKFETKVQKIVQTKASDSVEIKLPVLSLPIFSGAIDEWLTFSDLFQAAVGKNDKLSEAQKLQYLKGALRGDAQKIVQSLSITDSNFKIAWNLLSERYFHKRDILSSLIRKFLNIPPLTCESHPQILKLVDSSKEYVRLIESLDVKLENAADIILMFIIQFKLDPVTRGWWERSVTGDKIPSLQELLQFLTNHARSLINNSQDFKKNTYKRVSLVASGFQPRCAYCKGNHLLNKCEAFLNMSVQKRINFVKSKNICLNCLTQFHSKATCRSSNRCLKCKRTHHTLLHYENAVEGSSDPQMRNTNYSNGFSVDAKVFTPSSSKIPSGDLNTNCEVMSNSITSCCSDIGSGAQVLLCTTLVNVTDSFGRVMTCRALLDPGSQASLITNECLERLCLLKRKTNVIISCLGASNTRTSGVSQIRFTPHFSPNPSFMTSVFVVSKIVGQLPYASLDSSCSEPFTDLTLADPLFYKTSSIDILLGVDIALPMLRGHTIYFGEGKPFAVRSQLGWLIAGSVSSSEKNSTVQVNNIQLVSDQLINKFWELDSVPAMSAMTSDEKACEEHFKASHYRDESGRYVVKLPFHTSPTQLGDSRTAALRRLKSLENSLSLDSEKYEQYRKFMREYESLKHMELVPQSEHAEKNAFYLPHFAVMRDSSTTTKLRVVFDGSSKSSSGQSLNDLMMIGPRIQDELYTILIRFRSFQVVVCADIEKMFRQVKVQPHDTDWQRILWRETPNEPIKEYRLLTVTYGTASAPFLSTRAMQQLALDEKDNFPLASQATLKHFYVDDLLSGASSQQEALELVCQLKGMMKKGGFNLRKWHSNVPSIFNEPLNEEEGNLIHIESDEEVNVLGIKWNTKDDCFCFTVAPIEDKLTFSKREILSEIAHVFDPLGFLSPCVVFMKIFLQELWKHNLAWDKPIPDELNRRWISFRKELPLIQEVKIPRCMLQPQSVEVEIHAFCDASEKAYCATIYVRCLSENSDIIVSLLTSKTKVSPLKTQSLPRLELCSALLLANLLHTVLRDFPLPIQRTIAWTDSTITLAWLSSEPYRWQSFVANRVSKIQTIIPQAKWCHVPGSENPADLGTRGLLPSQLINCDQWFRGPSWLSQPIGDFEGFQSRETLSLPEIALKEEKRCYNISASTVEELAIISKYSSWSKLLRVLTYCFRFINNCLHPENKCSGFLTTEEIERTKTIIVKMIQRSEFEEDISLLLKSKPLKTSSKILCLNPFLDKEGVLRVGGRLKNAKIPESQKYPILLPRKHFINELIINHYHLKYLHAAPQLLMCVLRQHYWIIHARSSIRKVLKKCVICCRYRAKLASQIMSDLPVSRVTYTRPFHRIGVDFAGPFMVKCRAGRGRGSFKSYVCVFVCFSTHAVHLEVVEDLSTSAFLESLKRFIARRGIPTEIFSDCGTNFKGADKEIQRSFLKSQRDESVLSYTASEGIKWIFNPPASPHFGGLWESAVKSMKHHLRRSVGAALLTYPEFTTLITQVEACLNSRPLTAMSEDPVDLEALTPSHFLIGAAISPLPEQDLTQEPATFRHRWQLRQSVLQHFWKRWSTEYLSQLQQRPKWLSPKSDLQVNDLVLLKEENVPPLMWRMGRILTLHPGADGRTRVVTVRTAHGELKRPIVKLCLLPV